MNAIDTFLRYSRQMMVPEIGAEGQQKLINSKVLVIGAGGLGCPILQYLACAGVGTIGIIDFDVIELHNLHRQILYNDKQTGKSKAIVAAEALKQLAPHATFQILDEKLTQANALQTLKSYDLIVDGSDNFVTRYLVNDTCVQLNKPLVYGSILNFEGQIAVFNNNGGKNLRNLFPEPPNAGDVPNCSLNGVINTLPGIIGTMMAQETIKLLCNMPVLYNELLIFNTLQWSLLKISF